MRINSFAKVFDRISSFFYFVFALRSLVLSRALAPTPHDSRACPPGRRARGVFFDGCRRRIMWLVIWIRPPVQVSVWWKWTRPHPRPLWPSKRTFRFWTSLGKPTTSSTGLTPPSFPYSTPVNDYIIFLDNRCVVADPLSFTQQKLDFFLRISKAISSFTSLSSNRQSLILGTNNYRNYRLIFFQLHIANYLLLLLKVYC